MMLYVVWYAKVTVVAAMVVAGLTIPGFLLLFGGW